MEKELKDMQQKTYNIFISYRRDGGFEILKKKAIPLPHIFEVKI